MAGDLGSLNVHSVTSRRANKSLEVWVRSSRFPRRPVGLFVGSGASNDSTWNTDTDDRRLATDNGQKVASFGVFVTALTWFTAPQNQYKQDRWLRSSHFRTPLWLRLAHLPRCDKEQPVTDNGQRTKRTIPPLPIMCAAYVFARSFHGFPKAAIGTIDAIERTGESPKSGAQAHAAGWAAEDPGVTIAKSCGRTITRDRAQG